MVDAKKNEKGIQKPTNVLILSHSFLPVVGGIEIMSLFLANTFMKAGYKVKIITWTEEVCAEDMPFDIIRKPQLITLLKEYKWSNIVIENNPVLGLSWPLIVLKKPLITVLHTWINRADGTKNWKDKLKNLWLKRPNKVIAVSDALRKKTAKNATVIKNPYRADEFMILRNIKRDNDFVFLGRLVSDKGVNLAILALSELHKLGYKMNLTIIGDGPEMNNLKQLVNENKLDEYIIFEGILKGLSLVEMLNKHKFILVPSTWDEPFGLVALEGMACGCIPIVSNGGGLPEAVGEAGVIFKKGDLLSLVNNIKNVLSAPDLVTNLEDASKKHLINYHSDFIGKKYIDVVNNILSKI